jgi:hypothetical protein
MKTHLRMKKKRKKAQVAKELRNLRKVLTPPRLES